MRQREIQKQDREEEQRLQQSATRLLREETVAAARRRDEKRENAPATKEKDATLVAWKERQKEMARLEDERIRGKQQALDDNADRRAAADANRRADRQAEVDKQIEAQQQTLRWIHAQQTQWRRAGT
jgi:hypothetical protein